MKKVLVLLFLCSSAMAALPQNENEVEIIRSNKQLIYTSIPMISKTFKGARDTQQRDEIEKICQAWIMKQIKNADAPYFRAWCTRETDVILREYRYTANLLIKNW